MTRSMSDEQNGSWEASDTELERFARNVERGDNCWIWVGPKDSHGYGIFYYKRSKTRAHRVSWGFIHGEIPSGLYVDHICHVNACVNPRHLRLVTIKQNAENLAGPYVTNTNGYLGVSKHSRSGKFYGRVINNGKTHCTRYFVKAEDAAEAIRQLRNSLFTHNDMDRTAA